MASVYATTLRNFAFNRETAEACQQLLKEGVQIHRTPDEILINFLNEWEKIQTEYAAKNPFYKKVIDSQRAYAEQIVPFRLSWFPPTTSRATTIGRTRSTWVSRRLADVGGPRASPAPGPLTCSRRNAPCPTGSAEMNPPDWFEERFECRQIRERARTARGATFRRPSMPSSGASTASRTSRAG